VERAQEILRNLERTEFDREGRPRLAHAETEPSAPGRQLPLFGSADRGVLDELLRADVNRMTPMEALALLADLQRRLAE
jgi:DNA mismatch repair ATPase MutS